MAEQTDGFKGQREVSKAIETLSRNISLHEERVKACRSIHKYGEGARIELLRINSETDDLVVKICCNALLLSLGETPTCSFVEIISEVATNRFQRSIAIKALVAANNHASRTILLEVYSRFYDPKRLNKPILKGLAELGSKYILEVFVRQILVRDERPEISDYIHEILLREQLIDKTINILRDTVRFSVDPNEVRLAFMNLYRVGDNLIDHQIKALVQSDQIPIAIQKYSIRLK